MTLTEQIKMQTDALLRARSALISCTIEEIPRSTIREFWFDRDKVEDAIAAIDALATAATAAPSPAAQQEVRITDEMVDTYLAANNEYWRQQDEMPLQNPSKFRNGTPKDATRVSLEAALRASPTSPALPAAMMEEPDGDIIDFAEELQRALFKRHIEQLREIAAMQPEGLYRAGMEVALKDLEVRIAMLAEQTSEVLDVATAPSQAAAMPKAVQSGEIPTIEDIKRSRPALPSHREPCSLELVEWALSMERLAVRLRAALSASPPAAQPVASIHVDTLAMLQSDPQAKDVRIRRASYAKVDSNYRYLYTAPPASPAGSELPPLPESHVAVDRSFLEGLANFLNDGINMQQVSFDEPPDYASEFDYRLAQAVSEIHAYLSARATVPAVSEEEMCKLVDQALALVQGLGTIGAMKWLARALSRYIAPTATDGASD